MDAPLGRLSEVSSSEDRTLYEYRRKRRLIRGLCWMGAAAVLVGVAVFLGRPAGRWYAWMFAVVPSLGASALAYCGMLDLLNRPLFQIEVDRRARTLSLAMPREQGHDLAKVRYSDVSSVEIREKDSPPAWIVALRLHNGKRIGLGLSDDPDGSRELAERFSALIGVDIVRPSGPDR